MQLRTLLEYIDFLIENRKVDLIAKQQGLKVLKAYRRDISATRNHHIVELLFGSSNTKAILDEDIPTDIINFFFEKVTQKYLQWVVNRYINREFMLEDYTRLKDYLIQFDRTRRLLAKKDINQYKSLTELEEAVDEVINKDTRSNKQKEKDEMAALFKNGEAKLIYRDNQIKVEVPKTENAACILGRGTRWCTSATGGNNMFKHYNDQGKLYIITTHDGHKFQFHYESQQFMDEKDELINMGTFMEDYPTIVKALPDLMDKIPVSTKIFHNIGGDPTKLITDLMYEYTRISQRNSVFDDNVIWTHTYRDVNQFAEVYGMYNLKRMVEYLDDKQQLEEDLKDNGRVVLSTFLNEEQNKIIDDYVGDINGQIDLFGAQIDALGFLYKNEPDLMKEVEDAFFHDLAENTWNKIRDYVRDVIARGFQDIMESYDIEIALEDDVRKPNFWDSRVQLGMSVDAIVSRLDTNGWDYDGIADESLAHEIQDHFGALDQVEINEQYTYMDLVSQDDAMFTKDLKSLLK